MRGYIDLSGEMIDVGRDGLKLHEVGVHEAILREKRAVRDSDDVSRFSVRVASDIVDEFDIIVSDTGDSLTKITSGATLHGLSIIWELFEKFIVEIESIRVKLMNTDNEVVGKLASSANRSIYVVDGHTTKRTVALPKWGTGNVTKIAKTLFIESSVLYQVCMAYSVYTRKDTVGYRKRRIGEIISRFYDHIRGQYMLFKALDSIMDEDIVVPHNYKTKFDSFVDNCMMIEG